jgi:hypothetical protein
MKRFLSKIGVGFLKTAVAFVILAVVARFVPQVNWFFFQKNEHDRVFYTLLEVEKALANDEHCDVLVFGSSNCENALDPKLFSELTGLRVFKFVTGAQTIDISAALTRYCAPKMLPQYVIIDAYPRFGGGLTEEGVERAVINSPDASTALVRTILAVDPSSLTTDYLWLARAIGTSVKPYTAADIIAHPHEFEMIAPGFTRTVNDPPSQPEPYYTSPLGKPAIACLNALSRDLAKTKQQLVLLVPPLQNAKVVLEDTLAFPALYPAARPDTCFFDGKHMRNACIEGYTTEVAMRFNALRGTLSPGGR